MTNPMTLKGNIGRTEYFLRMAVFYLFSIILFHFAFRPYDYFFSGINLAVMVLMAVSGWTAVAATVTRFHDLEKSGWYYFALLIPFYNIYLNIMLLFFKGLNAKRRHGEIF